MAEQQVVEEPKPFDAAAYLKQANEADAAVKAGKTAPVTEPAKPEPAKEAAKPEEPTEERDKRISRSDRRRAKQFEELGYLRGKVETLEQMMAGKAATPAEATEDPEPVRTAYSSDHDYQRALGRWDARQEAKKAVTSTQEEAQAREQDRQWSEHVDAMYEKMLKDAKTIPGYAEMAAKISEDGEDGPIIITDSMLDRLVKGSEFRAHVLMYFAQHPDTLEAFNAEEDGPKKMRDFGRLETKAEMLYTSAEPSKTAAQAVEETPKDRVHPAEAQAGRNSVERDADKPRPTAEVAARGGSAPPEEPRIGSREWMERENARERQRQRG